MTGKQKQKNERIRSSKEIRIRRDTNRERRLRKIDLECCFGREFQRCHRSTVHLRVVIHAGTATPGRWVTPLVHWHHLGNVIPARSHTVLRSMRCEWVPYMYVHARVCAGALWVCMWFQQRVHGLFSILIPSARSSQAKHNSNGHIFTSKHNCGRQQHEQRRQSIHPVRSKGINLTDTRSRGPLVTRDTIQSATPAAIGYPTSASQARSPVYRQYLMQESNA